MADEKIIFSMVGVSKTFTNQKKVLNNIYLSFFYGAKIGIIGLNGSGKSTLMKIIAGLDKNFQGEVVFSPGYTVGYLEQEPQLDDSKTVREVVEEGCAATVALLKEYEQINQQLCEPMDDDTMARLIERQGELYEQIDHASGWELDSVLERAMDALRCPDPDQSVKVLSGGERRRVALCRLLLQQPDVLLLDEPTNHLDAESIDWLEQHLQQYKGTVIAVTHDRYFLDNVAGWILELDRGEGIPWKGNYSGWLEQKSKRLEMEEKQASKRRKTLERELEWVRMSPAGRHAKSKARLSAYDKMLNEDAKQQEEKLEIYIPNGPRLGDVVIEAHDVKKAFGDRVLYENLNFTLPPAGIVGVIGPNGTGKTTLFRMIMGLEQPTAGTFTVGQTVKLSYVDQQHKSIDPEKTVYEVISQNSEWIQLGNRREPMWRASTLREPIRRRSAACCRAASAIACIWPSHSRKAATCCCSTSRPTTSMSTRCVRWRRAWRISPAVPSSSRTTVGFWIVSPRISSRSRVTRRWSSIRDRTASSRSGSVRRAATRRPTA